MCCEGARPHSFLLFQSELLLFVCDALALCVSHLFLHGPLVRFLCSEPLLLLLSCLFCTFSLFLLLLHRSFPLFQGEVERSIPRNERMLQR